VTEAKIQETPHRVVVWDPSDNFWDGAVVTQVVANSLHARGVVTLPVVPDMFRASGVGGFAKRCWGAGLPLGARASTHAAPLTMFCVPGMRGLAWVARLVPDGEPPRAQYGGVLRFVADSGQRLPAVASYQELSSRDSGGLQRNWSPADLGAPDAEGGWCVGGSGLVSVGQEGHYGFSLYGAAPGLRVAWLAASQCPAK
jgi:hypothetical protein